MKPPSQRALPSNSKRAPIEAAIVGQSVSRMLVFKPHSGETEHDHSAVYTHRYSESNGRARSEKWRLGSTFQETPASSSSRIFLARSCWVYGLPKSLTSASSRPWWTIALRV